MLLRSEPLNFSNNEIALFGFVAIVGFLLAPTIGMTIFFLGGAFGSWIGSYTYYIFNSDFTHWNSLTFNSLISSFNKK